MSWNPETAVRMAALAAAFMAKSNTLTPEHLDRLTDTAAAHLPDDHSFRVTLEGWAKALHGQFGNADLVQDAGEQLHAHIETLSMPVPPGQERKDING